MKLPQKLCENLSEILNPQIGVCKICFKDIKPKRISSIWSKNPILCEICTNLFKAKFKKSRIHGVPVIAIYEYDSTIRTYLYQFKACFDYELYPVFLYRFANIFHIVYHGYVIVPAPSFIEDDEKRGFNHVEMMFSVLRLKIVKVFSKTEHHKQTDCTKKNRSDISKYMKVNESVHLKGKKILLVDDVLTTGSTMKTMIHHIKKFKPSKIKILVLSKVRL